MEPLKERKDFEEGCKNSKGEALVSGMENCNTNNIPENTKQKMFKDAGTILAEETNIVPVPGTNMFLTYLPTKRERLQ